MCKIKMFLSRRLADWGRNIRKWFQWFVGQFYFWYLGLHSSFSKLSISSLLISSIRNNLSGPLQFEAFGIRSLDYYVSNLYQIILKYPKNTMGKYSNFAINSSNAWKRIQIGVKINTPTKCIFQIKNGLRTSKFMTFI